MNKVVTFGEVIMRLSTPDFLRFSQADTFEISIGGSESNVATSLSQFGVPVSFVTRLPKNDIAQKAIMYLRKHGVDISKIIYGGQRLGIYYLETGAISRGSKIVYDRVGSSISEVQVGMIDWEKVFTDANWFHWTGITPALSQSAADVSTEALKVANRLGLTISCDFNYRSKLWKYDVEPKDIMPEMIALCDIVLCSKEDISDHFGIKPNHENKNNDREYLSEEAFLSISEQLVARYPKIKKVVTSLRENISASHNNLSAMLYSDGHVFKSPIHHITNIVDRVGGGDALMAGLIYGFIAFPKENQKVIDFAIAASVLKHTVRGDANMVSLEEVENLLYGDHSGAISR